MWVGGQVFKRSNSNRGQDVELTAMDRLLPPRRFARGKLLVTALALILAFVLSVAYVRYG